MRYNYIYKNIIYIYIQINIFRAFNILFLLQFRAFILSNYESDQFNSHFNLLIPNDHVYGSNTFP